MAISGSSDNQNVLVGEVVRSVEQNGEVLQQTYVVEKRKLEVVEEGVQSILGSVRRIARLVEEQSGKVAQASGNATSESREEAVKELTGLLSSKEDAVARFEQKVESEVAAMSRATSESISSIAQKVEAMSSGGRDLLQRILSAMERRESESASMAEEVRSLRQDSSSKRQSRADVVDEIARRLSGQPVQESAQGGREEGRRKDEARDVQRRILRHVARIDERGEREERRRNSMRERDVGGTSGEGGPAGPSGTGGKGGAPGGGVLGDVPRVIPPVIPKTGKPPKAGPAPGKSGPGFLSKLLGNAGMLTLMYGGLQGAMEAAEVNRAIERLKEQGKSDLEILNDRNLNSSRMRQEITMSLLGVGGSPWAQSNIGITEGTMGRMYDWTLRPWLPEELADNEAVKAVGYSGTGLTALSIIGKLAGSTAPVSYLGPIAVTLAATSAEVKAMEKDQIRSDVAEGIIADVQSKAFKRYQELRSEISRLPVGPLKGLTDEDRGKVMKAYVYYYATYYTNSLARVCSAMLTKANSEMMPISESLNALAAPAVDRGGRIRKLAKDYDAMVVGFYGEAIEKTSKEDVQSLYVEYVAKVNSRFFETYREFGGEGATFKQYVESGLPDLIYDSARVKSSGGYSFKQREEMSLEVLKNLVLEDSYARTSDAADSLGSGWLVPDELGIAPAVLSSTGKQWVNRYFLSPGNKATHEEIQKDLQNSLAGDWGTEINPNVFYADFLRNLGLTKVGANYHLDGGALYYRPGTRKSTELNAGRVLDDEYVPDAPPKIEHTTNVNTSINGKTGTTIEQVPQPLTTGGGNY